MKDNKIPSPLVSLLPVFVLILLLFVTIRTFGSDSVYCCSLADVQRVYIVWLFHRFETLWHKGLGVVSGVWHSGYSLLYGYHLATWTWCCYRALYAVHHFPYYRMFPCHFLLRVEKIA